MKLSKHRVKLLTSVLILSLFLAGCMPIQPPAPEAAAPAAEQAVAPEQPNVLLILLDDVGFADLERFGGDIPTPHIDSLAEQGLQVTDFHVTPVCSTTRSELLTGQDHHRNGFGTMDARGIPMFEGQPGYEGFLNDNVTNVAATLRDNGYHTYMVGKWHLGHDEHDPYNEGFEESFALMQGQAGHYQVQSLGEWSRTDYTQNGQPVEIPADFYSSTFYTDRLIESIDKHHGDGKPFFSYVAYTAAHDPLQAPAEWIEKFKGKYDAGYEVIRAERIARMKEMGIFPADAAAAPPSPDVKPWDELSDDEKAQQIKGMEVYAAMIGAVDAEIGRLLAHLEELGELDNTWVIFCTDNGANGETLKAYYAEEYVAANYDNSAASIGTPNSYYVYGPGWAQAGSGPFRMYKVYTAEGGIRTPLIIRGPEIARAGERSDLFVNATDIFPTILDITGVAYPQEVNGAELYPLQGASLLPYLNGESDTLHSDEQIFGWEVYGRAALRKGDWKILWLREPYGAGAWQLYNLATDPGETTDLATENPEKLKELTDAWEQYVQENGVIYEFGNEAGL